jgi:N-acetylmuramoyl-L-alanine amidase
MKTFKIFIALAAMASFAFINPSNEPHKIKVVLDAGHGGNDFGVTHGSFIEKEITSQIIGKIHALNKNEDIEIEFTRVSDDMVNLADRTEMINRIKPDLVLSLHVNYNKNTDASGFEIFTAKDNAHKQQSIELAKKLSDKLAKNLSANSRGIKEAPFMILNKSEAPALVVELGFL